MAREEMTAPSTIQSTAPTSQLKEKMVAVRGKKCIYFHPKLCYDSVNKKECYREKCNYFHLPKTTRIAEKAAVKIVENNVEFHQPQYSHAGEAQRTNEIGKSSTPFQKKTASPGTPREGIQDDVNAVHTSAADGPDVTATAAAAAAAVAGRRNPNDLQSDCSNASNAVPKPVLKSTKTSAIFGNTMGLFPKSNQSKVSYYDSLSKTNNSPFICLTETQFRNTNATNDML